MILRLINIDWMKWTLKIITIGQIINYKMNKFKKLKKERSKLLQKKWEERKRKTNNFLIKINLQKEIRKDKNN
jgi:hypothetical protein